MMLQQDTPDDFVIATGYSYPLNTFVEEAFRCFDLDCSEHVVIDRGQFRPAVLSLGRANPAKAREKLGWSATYQMKDVVRMMAQEEMRFQGRAPANSAVVAGLTPALARS
jgi:GDPmannose 4,6-dehydratase